MSISVILLLAFLLGCVTGLRTMTGPALVCWGAHLGPHTTWLHLVGSPLAFLANPVSLVIFTILAVGELIGDKLPQTPSRLSLFPLAARAVFGGLCGVALAIAGHASVAEGTITGVAGGAILGLAGALIGANIGFHLRRLLTAAGKLPDFAVALAEDAVAIGGGLMIISRF